MNNIPDEACEVMYASESLILTCEDELEVSRIQLVQQGHCSPGQEIGQERAVLTGCKRLQASSCLLVARDVPKE